MATYIMLNRLSPDARKRPESVGDLNKQARNVSKKNARA